MLRTNPATTLSSLPPSLVWVGGVGEGGRSGGREGGREGFPASMVARFLLLFSVALVADNLLLFSLTRQWALPPSLHPSIPLHFMLSM